MKAIVLAGGYATRLWPITRHRPKMFLPLGGTTAVDRIYAELEGLDRIDEVFVSTNERFAPDFETHIESEGYEKPRLSVEETTAEAEKLGVVGALSQLLDREGIDDDLLVVAGDNLFGFEMRDFLDRFEAVDGPTIAIHDVGDPDLATSYGVVELDDNRVVDLQEKPEEPPSTLVSTGCYAFPGRRFRCSKATSKAGTTRTSPAGSSRGSRSANRPAPTRSRMPGSISVPARATWRRSPGSSTATRGSPRARPSKTPRSGRTCT